MIAKGVPAVEANAAKRFWSSVDKSGPVPQHLPELGPCWIWTAGKHQGSGYGKANLHRKIVLAHRLAFAIKNGPILPGVDVLHRCDNRECVRPEHLFLGNALTNARDRDAKGRSAAGERHGRYTKPESNAVGERNGRAKLTPAQVSELRRIRRTTGIAYKKLGAIFGVSEAQAIRIAKGVQWVEGRALATAEASL